MKKKILNMALILILVSVLLVLTGCGGEEISKKESYVGYYADIDSDGTVDGVIYVDLMDSENTSGEWRY